MMPRTLWCVMLALAAINAVSAQQAPNPAPFIVPAWAFPTISPEIASKPPFDSVLRLRLPRSANAFTLAQLKNFYMAADWYPGAHPTMPEIVAHGRKPGPFACGYCHLADGQGRSENATLAGLPVEYFERQVADMRAGTRRSALEGWGPSANMSLAARSVTDSEVGIAARYFASLRATKRYTVIERARIPATYEAGGLYSVRSGADSQPIGARIIEITRDLHRHELRDPSETFIAYVPPGSIARGRRIATMSSTIPPTSCVTCHGPALRGVGVIPPLAGRSPSYILRQLVGFRTGSRSASTSVPMQSVVAALDLDDMIAVAAYAGSLRP